MTIKLNKQSFVLSVCCLILLAFIVFQQNRQQAHAQSKRIQYEYATLVRTDRIVFPQIKAGDFKFRGPSNARLGVRGSEVHSVLAIVAAAGWEVVSSHVTPTGRGRDDFPAVAGQTVIILRRAKR